MGALQVLQRMERYEARGEEWVGSDSEEEEGLDAGLQDWWFDQQRRVGGSDVTCSVRGLNAAHAAESLDWGFDVVALRRELSHQRGNEDEPEAISDEGDQKGKRNGRGSGEDGMGPDESTTR